MLAKQGAHIEGTRRGARPDASQGPTGARHPAQASPDASKTGCPNRCQAPGAAPGRMLANRGPTSVPGTRCEARLDASKTGSPNRCQAPGAAPGRMLANRGPKSVPATRCEARSDASKTGSPNRCQAPGAAPGRMLAKQGAQIGARHPVRRQAGC